MVYFAAVAVTNADSVKTRSGHLLSGEINEESAEFVILVPEKFSLRKKEVRTVTAGAGTGDAQEFFGKVELKDGSKILGWIEKLGDGGVVVKKHALFGDNYRISRKEIRRLAAVGKTTMQLADLGEISGFLSGENAETYTVELREQEPLKIAAKHIAAVQYTKKPRAAAEPPAPRYLLGLSGQAALPLGTFTEYLKRGYGGGVDYLQTWPRVLDVLGRWLLSARFQLYEGDKLKIYYGQLYAGIDRPFRIFKGHALYTRLVTGVNFEQIRETKFVESNFVIGAAFHGGYRFSWSDFAVQAAALVQYFYDQTYPLIGIGGEVGFLYAL